MNPSEQPMKNIDKLVDRFLQWPLPDSVRCDACVTIQGYRHRSGTNLLDATEAKQMIEYLLAENRPEQPAELEKIANEAAEVCIGFNRIIITPETPTPIAQDSKNRQFEKCKVEILGALQRAVEPLQKENEELREKLTRERKIVQLLGEDKEAFQKEWQLLRDDRDSLRAKLEKIKHHLYAAAIHSSPGAAMNEFMKAVAEIKENI